MIQILLVINSLIFFCLAAIHVYWALGGKWGENAVVPTNGNGKKLFNPGVMGTLIVALGLLLFMLTDLAYSGLIKFELNKNTMNYAITAIGAIFLVRAIGNFNNVGFTKRRTQSVFAKMDTRYYAPLCLFIGVTHLLALYLYL
ncbi:DUF3995 domain-containing protein [Pedobacter foliorum]|uniref:DUF3995 domain-containing protein n=1 Tax=Pedobacter foliorum TaxID=2739058 RepID=UPI001565F2DD|nr:DUF3995 domain-containing protein [Pedobacter foliorum]NRF37203.1 DUF3995 domain-containing protein [Pedobacter foliorum]